MDLDPTILDIPEQYRCLPVNETWAIGPQASETSQGFSIIGIRGIGGIGKTTALNRLLALYPQMIAHHEYAQKPFTARQLVWAKRECPFDGSVKGLCIHFLQYGEDPLGSQRITKDVFTRQGRQIVDPVQAPIWLHPCRFAQHTPLTTYHPASIPDQIKGHLVAAGCRWCPKLDRLGEWA